MSSETVTLRTGEEKSEASMAAPPYPHRNQELVKRKKARERASFVDLAKVPEPSQAVGALAEWVTGEAEQRKRRRGDSKWDRSDPQIDADPATWRLYGVKDRLESVSWNVGERAGAAD